MSKGLKRICMNCGTRFYDLDKTPIICPSCETEFTGDVKVKSRRGRPAATPEAPVKEAPKEVAETEDEDEVEDIDADDDIVSLDDMDDDEDISLDDDDEDEDLAALDDGFDDIDDIEDEEEEEKN